MAESRMFSLIGIVNSLEEYNERINSFNTIPTDSPIKSELIATFARLNSEWAKLAAAPQSTEALSVAMPTGESSQIKKRKRIDSPVFHDDEGKPIVVKKENIIAVDDDEAKEEISHKETRTDDPNPEEKLPPREHLLKLRKILIDKTETFKSFEEKLLTDMRGGETLPRYLQESISFELFENPVMTGCEHTFSQSTLERLKQAKDNRCPTCRAPVEFLIKNRQLMEIVDDYTEKYYAEKIQPEKTKFEAEKKALNQEIESLEFSLGETSAEKHIKAIEEASQMSISSAKANAFINELLKLQSKNKIDSSEISMITVFFWAMGSSKNLKTEQAREKFNHVCASLFNMYICDETQTYIPNPAYPLPGRIEDLSKLLNLPLPLLPPHQPWLGEMKQQPAPPIVPVNMGHIVDSEDEEDEDKEEEEEKAEEEKEEEVVNINILCAEARRFLRLASTFKEKNVTFSSERNHNFLHNNGHLVFHINGHSAPFSPEEKIVEERYRAFLDHARVMGGHAKINVIQALITENKSFGVRYDSSRANFSVNYLLFLFTNVQQGGAGWDINERFYKGRSVEPLQVKIFNKGSNRNTAYETFHSSIPKRTAHSMTTLTPLMLIILNAHTDAIKNIIRPLFIGLNNASHSGGIMPAWSTVPKEGEHISGIKIKFTAGRAKCIHPYTKRHPPTRRGKLHRNFNEVNAAPLALAEPNIQPPVRAAVVDNAIASLPDASPFHGSLGRNYSQLIAPPRAPVAQIVPFLFIEQGAYQAASSSSSQRSPVLFQGNNVYDEFRNAVAAAGNLSWPLQDRETHRRYQQNPDDLEFLPYFLKDENKENDNALMNSSSSSSASSQIYSSARFQDNNEYDESRNAAAAGNLLGPLQNQETHRRYQHNPDNYEFPPSYPRDENEEKNRALMNSSSSSSAAASSYQYDSRDDSEEAEVEAKEKNRVSMNSSSSSSAARNYQYDDGDESEEVEAEGSVADDSSSSLYSVRSDDTQEDEYPLLEETREDDDIAEPQRRNAAASSSSSSSAARNSENRESNAIHFLRDSSTMAGGTARAAVGLFGSHRRSAVVDAKGSHSHQVFNPTLRRDKAE